jgi:uncharacterized damage-inducible protein DinB
LTRDDIQLLYEYDRSADKRVSQAVSALSAEQFKRDLGGSFRPVRDTFVHVIGAECGWLGEKAVSWFRLLDRFALLVSQALANPV